MNNLKAIFLSHFLCIPPTSASLQERHSNITRHVKYNFHMKTLRIKSVEERRLEFQSIVLYIIKSIPNMNMTCIALSVTISTKCGHGLSTNLVVFNFTFMFNNMSSIFFRIPRYPQIKNTIVNNHVEVLL